jgi:hypothetical protein
MKYHKWGFTFITPAIKKYKKYSVYYNDVYITSFGQLKPNMTPYTQYKDRIGAFSAYDNNDKKKRANYRKRHKNDHIDDINSPGFWSWHVLWT